MSAVNYLDKIIATGGNDGDAWVSLLNSISKDNNEYIIIIDLLL